MHLSAIQTQIPADFDVEHRGRRPAYPRAEQLRSMVALVGVGGDLVQGCAGMPDRIHWQPLTTSAATTMIVTTWFTLDAAWSRR